MESVIGLPFVSHVNQELRPTLENPKEWLKRCYVRFYTNIENVVNYGTYKNMGYAYDLKPYLKKYLYKLHGRWHEAYAPNKTSLRKMVYGTITEIIEK